MTVNQALRAAEDRLRAAGVASAGTDACLLMAHALGDTPGHLPTRLREDLDERARLCFESLLARRAAREPLAYIVGYTEFMGFTFRCDARAFVPRPDTETLVEAVLAEVRESAEEPLLMAEIGVGTGCVAVSLARLVPQARVYATEVSCEALELATENVRLHGMHERVWLLEGRDLEPLREAEVVGRLKVLVSNPPYIPTAELPALEPEVSRAEPSIALNGGPDGLDFYRRVLPQLAELPALSLVAFEFGFGQEEAVAQLAQQHLPGWALSIRRDLSGLPRVLVARRS